MVSALITPVIDSYIEYSLTNSGERNADAGYTSAIFSTVQKRLAANGRSIDTHSTTAPFLPAAFSLNFRTLMAHTAVITRADGTVADVVIGYNNDLTPVVIQKAALAVK